MTPSDCRSCSAPRIVVPVDLLRTSVGGDVTLGDSDFGVSVGGAVVGGSLSVTGTSRDALIGATSDGSADQWGNTVGGDLVLTGNTATLQVAGTTVGFVDLVGHPSACPSDRLAVEQASRIGSNVISTLGGSGGVPPGLDRALGLAALRHLPSF